MDTKGSPGGRILLVEDDDLVRETFAAMLESEGYAVAQAAHGQAALDQLRHGACADLILLDLMMPVMDGWEFRAEQRRDPALADTPVVIVTASGGDDVTRPLEPADVLRKPLNPEALVGVVRRLLPPRKQSVLVVDDEPMIRQILQLLFRRTKISAWTAGSGQEALVLYKEHRDEIGLVLLDVLMPGQDGPATLAALRAIDPAVRCCFMSGHADEATTERLGKLTDAPFFPKPFRLDELGKTVRDLLRKT